MVIGHGGVDFSVQVPTQYDATDANAFVVLNQLVVDDVHKIAWSEINFASSEINKKTI